MKQIVILILCAGVGYAASPASKTQPLTVSRMFSDHAVLQRDVDMPVWGWAEPATKVTVSFADQEKTATAGADGKWVVKLAPMKSNTTGQTMVVWANGGKQKAEFKDILVGEVWLCSGQSNMSMGVGICKRAPGGFDLKNESFSMIRHVTIGGNTRRGLRPKDAAATSWVVCTPKTVGSFTAVGYFFARRVFKETNVPVGLIHSSIWATSIEPWTAKAGFLAVDELPEIQAGIRYSQTGYRQAMKDYLAKARQWADDTETALTDGTPRYSLPSIPKKPHVYESIYAVRIHPIIPYAIRGVLWYQGENNGTEGIEYMYKMRALIEGWRKNWNQKQTTQGGPERDFPFYYVQLASWQKATTDPDGGDGWARVRMAQQKAMSITNTGMGSALDLHVRELPGDIHPYNKIDVGYRLALWALAKDYGKTDVVYSGPIFRKMTVKGNTAILEFDHIGGGLMVGEKIGIAPTKEVKNGTLEQFAMCGAGGKWFWADATLVGDTVVVSSKQVKTPKAVRYAYRGNPEGCNLYNKAGLPASPFTTDGDWK